MMQTCVHLYAQCPLEEAMKAEDHGNFCSTYLESQNMVKKIAKYGRFSNIRLFLSFLKFLNIDYTDMTGKLETSMGKEMCEFH